MILGIDATNIIDGGGIVHLYELLDHFKPNKYKFKKIIIWSNSNTLHKINNYKWLEKKKIPVFFQNIFLRMFWQIFRLNKNIMRNECNLLVILGGTYLGNFKPYVAFCQNQLPFSIIEWNKYSYFVRIKFLIQNYLQLKTFTNSDLTIFLTQSSKNTIQNSIKKNINSKVINHGVNKIFNKPPKNKFDFLKFSDSNPLRILYVSRIEWYKNHHILVKSIKELKDEGLPIKLTLIGTSYRLALKSLNQLIDKFDFNRNFITYINDINYKKIHHYYMESDLFIFPSTCETFGMPLIEAASTSLPIACSDIPVFREILGDTAYYFEKNNKNEIKLSIKKYYDSPKFRYEMSKKSYARSQNYNWENSSDIFYSAVTKLNV